MSKGIGNIRMTIKESLNILDTRAIDNNEKFLDLRNLYEAANLDYEKKKKLKELIDKNEDPEVIAAYIINDDDKLKEAIVEESRDYPGSRYGYDYEPLFFIIVDEESNPVDTFMGTETDLENYFKDNYDSSFAVENVSKKKYFDTIDLIGMDKYYGEEIPFNESYKLSFYCKQEGPNQGDLDHEEFFDTRLEAIDRYEEVFDRNAYSLNPTMWIGDGNSWKRLNEPVIESLNESYGSKFRSIINHVKSVMPKDVHFSYDDYQVIPDDLGSGMRFQIEFDSKDPTLQDKIMNSIERKFYGVETSRGWGRDWDYYISIRVDDKACNESLNEASYGGAYDIEDDMFFTKEELMEFGYDLVEQFSAWSEGKCELSDLYMTSPVDLVMEVSDEDGAEHQAKIKIDMRKIKLPKDIYKYSDIILKQWKDSYNEYHEYDESLNESSQGVEYLEDELADKSQYPSIEDAYQRNELTICKFKDRDVYYIQSCPNRIYKLVRREMKKYYPELTYLYDESLTEEKKSITEGKFKDSYNHCYVEIINGKPTFAYDNYSDAVRGLSYDKYDSPNKEYTIMKLDDGIYTKVDGWPEASVNESLTEDTIKTKSGKWVNKGKEGTHGKFKTKKEADAQRKAIFANGYRESLDEDDLIEYYGDEISKKYNSGSQKKIDKWLDRRKVDSIGDLDLNGLRELAKYVGVKTKELDEAKIVEPKYRDGDVVFIGDASGYQGTFLIEGDFRNIPEELYSNIRQIKKYGNTDDNFYLVEYNINSKHLFEEDYKKFFDYVTPLLKTVGISIIDMN